SGGGGGLHDAEQVLGVGARGQCLTGGVLDGGSVHHRIGIGQADLDHVATTLHHGLDDRDGALQVGKACGDVSHECGSVLLACGGEPGLQCCCAHHAFSFESMRPK